MNIAETESNDSSVHDFDEEEQPSGHIDHISPRYFIDMSDSKY